MTAPTIPVAELSGLRVTCCGEPMAYTSQGTGWQGDFEHVVDRFACRACGTTLSCSAAINVGPPAGAAS